MPLDPRIAMSVKPADMAESVSQGFTLAGQMEQQKQVEEQRKDRETLQTYLKNGGNFATPEGLSTAIEDLKGQISPNAYQTMIKGHQQLQENAINMERSYANLSTDQINNQIAQSDFIAQSLESVVSAYDKAAKEKGEPAAIQDMEAQKLSVLQAAAQQKLPGTDRPVFEPAMLQKFQNMSLPEIKSALQSTKWYRDRQLAGLDMMKRAAEIKRIETQTRADEAEARRKAEGGVAGGSLVGIVTGGGNVGIKNLPAAISAVQAEHPWLTLEETGERYQQAKGLRNTVNTQRTALGKLEGFERTALANIDSLAEEVKNIRSKQAVDLPVANRFLSFIKQQAGIPYDQAVGLYGREIAAELTKLASSATAAGTGGTLTDREEWNKFFEKNSSFDQIMKTVEAARISAGNRIKSSREAIMENEDEMKRLWAEPGTEAAKPAGEPAGKPAGKPTGAPAVAAPAPATGGKKDYSGMW